MAFSLRAGTNWCHDFPKLARESGFRFNRHESRVRVDWKRISSIDIDRVICERDLSAIDDNVNNIVDCCLESEYDVKILDPNFVKLFRLAQLAIEYLLYCKQYLDHSVVILKDELRSKIEENAKLNNRVKASEDNIKELKEKLKERSRDMERKLSDSHGEIHKCPQCPKTFISSVFMSAHVNRRHPSSHNSLQLTVNSPVLDERYRAEAEKLHNEIKSLKERLNLTERLIRKESDKLSLIPDSVAASAIETSNDKSRDQGASKEEQQSIRRYQEDLKNFKETLFSEIRQQNLKLVDKLSMGRDDAADHIGDNAKELIRQQENEIQRLRDQLYKRLTPDIEDIQVKLNNQEDLWQSKIENLEKRHRGDIEKLYEQLKITRESADRMRVDYITKINDLERESRERHTKSIFLPDHSVQSVRCFSPSEQHENPKNLAEDRGNSEAENISFPVALQPKNRLISNKTDHAIEERVVESLKDESVANGKFVVSSVLSGVSSKKTSSDHYNFHKDRNKRNRKRWQKNLSSPYNDSREAPRNGFDKNRSSNSLRSTFKEIDNPRQDALHIFSPSRKGVEKAQVHEVKESFATITNDGRRSSMNSSVSNASKRKNQPVGGKSESFDSVTESEASSSISSSSSSESWSESGSPDASEAAADSRRENNEEKRTSRIEVKSNYRNDQLNQERIVDDTYDRQSDTEMLGNKDMIELLNSKLRDLGVDPEWQGIPKATMKQIMETVRHHRNLNCKKYRKLDEIRRELFEQVTRKLSSVPKVDPPDEISPETALDRFLTNVKTSRTWKALSILDKNDGSHKTVSNYTKGTRRRSSELIEKSTRSLADSSNEINENVQPLRKDIKSKSPREQRIHERQESQISKRVPRIVGNNSSTSRNQPQKPSIANPSGDSTGDLKYLSHSYESLKSFRQYKDANSPRQQRTVWERKSSVPETLVASSPQRNERVIEVVDVIRKARDSSFNFTNGESTIKMQQEEEDEEKEDDDNEFPKSPGNRLINKSVIKSASRGSTASLVKKKVVFDLENKARESPENPTDKDDNHGKTTRDSGESDCEISSINEETNANEAYREEQPLGNVVLKTFQSEKIARISKQIEQQLSVARRKPIGSVEAMFADKLSVSKNDKISAVLEVPSMYSDITSAGRNMTDHPQAAPRTSRNFNADSRRKLSTSSINYGSKDSNLDKDIDELLEIE